MSLLNDSSVIVYPQRNEPGFSLVDVLVVTAMLGIVMAIGMPLMTDVIDRQRLGQATREVARELQAAKQKAVANNRPMRVVFNCPSAGSYRVVELIGSPSAPDAADALPNPTRCDVNEYPSPPADGDPLTRPNLDGLSKTIDPRIVFADGVQAVEFWSDGTAHYDDGTVPWGIIPTTGIELQLVYGATTKTIQVNGLGRIQIEP